MGGFSIWHWLVVLLVVVLIFGQHGNPTRPAYRDRASD